MKTVLIIILRSCETVSRKLCINREYKSESSQFSHTFIVVARTMKFLEVVTPPYIYQYPRKGISHINIYNNYYPGGAGGSPTPSDPTVRYFYLFHRFG